MKEYDREQMGRKKNDKWRKIICKNVWLVRCWFIGDERNLNGEEKEKK